jgi:hypothetical protein
VLTRREKEIEWEKHAREVNKKLNVRAFLDAQKWKPPVGTSYDDLWDMTKFGTWG